MNNVILIGRLTRDPEVKYLPNSGAPTASFSLAVDRDYKNKDGTVSTDFIPVQTIGKLAEVVSNYLTKGSKVAIQGSIRIDSYEKDGAKKSFTKVFANKIQFIETKKQEGDKGTPSFEAVENDEDIPF